MDEPVRIGLVGTGPWARAFTAPMLAGSPDCTLVGVWGRRSSAAAELASLHGTVAVASLDALIDDCEAVAFAVPPDVQADVALRAVSAGRAVLLDKPVGMTREQAHAVADAVHEAGVVSQLILTNRYTPVMRAFLAEAAGFAAYGGRAAFVHGEAMAGRPFGTPWRLTEGCLLDLGPHVLDALDAALGTIVDVTAAGDPRRVVTITCQHASGAVSSAVMSGSTPVAPSGLSVELVGPAGRLALDLAGAADAADRMAAAMRTVAAEFAHAVRSGTPHELDATRGLHLQRLIARAADTLSL